jgi:hypothetical protein
MHSGFEVLPAKELNGITLAGVGSGTQVEYVQVHNSSDDGIELFGGTVNMRYIILTGNDDDSLDTDNGYRGGTQFLIVRQRDTGGDRLFEMSCAGNAAFCSHPAVANATMIRRSSTNSNGLELNTGTDLTLVNTVLHNTGATTTSGIRATDAATQTAAPEFRSVYMSGFTTAFANTATQTLFETTGHNNTTSGTSTLSGVTNGTNEAAVTRFSIPTGAATAQNGYGYFSNPTYIGAVKDGADTWYNGWSCGIATGSNC